VHHAVPEFHVRRVVPLHEDLDGGQQAHNLFFSDLARTTDGVRVGIVVHVRGFDQVRPAQKQS
jgi:hypothetical protein